MAFRPGSKACSPREPAAPRKKALYIGAPACFALEAECKLLWEAFCRGGEGFVGGIYIVGSAILRSDWRDVDLRLILKDEEFERLFPDAGQHWEQDPRWLVLTIAISERLSKVTGLPIDFQFQPQSTANRMHGGKPRCPVGMRFMPEREVRKRRSEEVEE